MEKLESRSIFNKKKSTDIKNLNNFQASVFFKIVTFSIYISKNFKNRIVSIWRKYNGTITFYTIWGLMLII